MPAQSAKKSWLAVLIVVLLGLIVRARGVGDVGLSMDEAGTLWAARGASALESVHRVQAVHGQSPLYYLVVRATLGACGESESTLRLTSVIAGALVPLLGFLAARSAAGARAGAIALVLLAFDPALVAQARSARPYALAEAATALAAFGLATTLASGRRSARLALWGGAVLAVYAHGIFFVLVPALLLAALLARSERYAARDALLDAALATGAMVPELIHLVRLFGRRGELAWLDTVDANVFMLLVPRGAWLSAGLGVLWAVARRARVREPADHGLTLFAILGLGAVVASVLLLLALGTNVVADRYLSAAFVLGPLLAARLIALLQRRLAAYALALAVLLGAPALDAPAPPQEWRDAARFLEIVARMSDGPVFLNTGFAEQARVFEPGGLSAEQKGFVASPLVAHPGQRPLEHELVILPKAWGLPGEVAFFEREVVPRIARSKSFVVVGRAPYVAIFEDWLRGRAPERGFHEVGAFSFVVREFAVPIRVARFQASW